MKMTNGQYATYQELGQFLVWLRDECFTPVNATDAEIETVTQRFVFTQCHPSGSVATLALITRPKATA